MRYEEGSVVPQDLPLAVALFRKACIGELAVGCSNLARMYEAGWGVPQDLGEAVALYRTACDGGGREGCYGVGMMYALGRGVRKNDDEALKYFEKACDLKSQYGCNDHAKLKTGATIEYREALGETERINTQSSDAARLNTMRDAMRGVIQDAKRLSAEQLK